MSHLIQTSLLSLNWNQIFLWSLVNQTATDSTNSNLRARRACLGLNTESELSQRYQIDAGKCFKRSFNPSQRRELPWMRKGFSTWKYEKRSGWTYERPKFATRSSKQQLAREALQNALRPPGEAAGRGGGHYIAIHRVPMSRRGARATPQWSSAETLNKFHRHGFGVDWNLIASRFSH